MRIVKYMPYYGLVNTVMSHKLANGKTKVRAYIAADEAPSGFPESTTALEEKWPNYVFDTMSIFQVLDPEAETKVYVVKEDGTWAASDNTVALMV